VEKYTLLLRMKNTFRTLTFLLCTLALANCNRPKDTSEVLTADSTVTDSTVANTNSIIDGTETNDTEEYRDIVAYFGATEDSIQAALANFGPLRETLTLSQRAIYIEDSLEMAGSTDTLITAPYKARAYKAILAYKKRIEAGLPAQTNVPSLLQLNRIPEIRDSTANILPQAGNSTLLADGNFFFVGGAPFISAMTSEDNTTYASPTGKPELRFTTSIPENTNFILTHCFRRKEAVKISFGPPLSSYDLGPHDIHGIGSIRHEFVNHIPVIFLTPHGPVPARIVSIKTNLFPNELPCVSDQPFVEFACFQYLNEVDILAIYMPESTTAVGEYNIDRPDRSVWTADLNNDGIADIACVSGTSGGASGIISAVLWFANIRGTWKIIDAGIEPDCT